MDGGNGSNLVTVWVGCEDRSAFKTITYGQGATALAYLIS
jgi:hypothetical protein